jgi:hypothetical protein
MANDKVAELTDKLENGVKDIFDGGKYAAYLQTMSRFHNYSTRNTLLIHLQMPEATRVAGYRAWQENFKRHVKKGEHGIRIFAPVANRDKEIEAEKIDKETGLQVLDETGEPVTETLQPVSNLNMRFRAVPVFDVSQTEGEPLPELAETLTGEVERYELFMDALRAVSPLPIVFEPMTGKDGYCGYGEKIGIREGMSEAQTVSAVVHEITHAKLHDRNDFTGNEHRPDGRTAEVEAESVSFVVNSRFSVDTGANAFGYIAEWSRGRELKELSASLDVIRKTAAELIEAIDGEYRALAKERGIDLTAAAPKRENAREQTAETSEPVPNAESPLALKHTETRRVGETVLMPLLYEDGNLNRSGKRSKVKIAPPVGKYALYSRDEGDNNYTYTMTNGGRLIMLGETARLGELTEQRLDEHIKALSDGFDKRMADPETWVDFAGAAVLDRISDADTHNAPIRDKRETQYRQEQSERVAAQKRERETRETAFNEAVNDIAEKLANGEKAEVEPDRNTDKNPLLALFAKYGVELPLATKGWVNKNLKAVQIYSGEKSGEKSFWLPKGVKVSETFSRAVWELRNKIIASREKTAGKPRIGMMGGLPVEVYPNGDAPVTPPPKQSVAKDLYAKLWERFPRFMSKEFSRLRLESDGFEPLSLEWTGKDRFSMMHTYKLNGDLCYDPDIVFEINRNAHTANAVMFQQSVPPLYRERQDNGEWLSVGADGEQHTLSERLGGEINDFANQWLDNIKAQGHIPVRANAMIDGTETQVTFAGDGTPILPDAEKTESPKKFAEPDLSLPDPAWTVPELAEYGYTEPDMYPLSVGRAVELFDANHPVYLLYPDNTEALAFDRDEIITFSSDGFCGITKADWEISPVRAAQLNVAAGIDATGENNRESELLTAAPGMFGIYQIKDAPELRDYRFSGNDEMKRLGLRVDRANYDLVHTAPLTIHDTQTNLNKIYRDFNIDRPAEFKGRAVSVSDVIVLQWRGEVSAHFVDDVGFKELKRFTGNEREQKITLTEQEALANIAKIKANNREHAAEPAKRGILGVNGKLAAAKAEAERRSGEATGKSKGEPERRSSHTGNLSV